MFIVPYTSVLVLKSGQGMNEQSPVATFLHPTNCCLCSGYYCVSQSVFVLKKVSGAVWVWGEGQVANFNPYCVHSFPGQGAGNGQVYTIIENKVKLSFYSHKILACVW